MPQRRLNVQDSEAILQNYCGYNHPLSVIYLTLPAAAENLYSAKLAE